MSDTDDATIEEARKRVEVGPWAYDAIAMHQICLSLIDIATRRGEERDKALGYVEKLKIDISGHKGVIGQQYDQIVALDSERDALAEELQALKQKHGL